MSAAMRAIDAAMSNAMHTSLIAAMLARRAIQRYLTPA
jgi:hypothetical protein